MRRIAGFMFGLVAGLASSAGVLMLGLGHQAAGLALFFGGFLLLVGVVVVLLLLRRPGEDL